MQQMPDGPDKIRERDRIDTEFQTLQHQQLEGLDDLAKALQRTYKHLGPQQVQQVRQQLQTVQQAQHQQHSLQIQALFLNGVDLRQNMDDLVGAIDQNIQGLETLNAEVAARLRQVSPKAAVETLVRALNGHEGPQARTDAQSLARSLLNLNPDGTEDAVLKGEPAIVAEVLRKNMGLAYL